MILQGCHLRMLKHKPIEQWKGRWYGKFVNKSRIAMLFGIGMLIASGIVISSCFNLQPPAILRVGTLVWPGYEPLYLARDLGYFQNHPIRLVDYPTISELQRAYRNSDLEAIALPSTEILNLAETVPDIRVILVNDFSEGADVILGKPNINQLQEIKGKRIGLEPPALGLFVLKRALERVNISSQDVQVEVLAPSEHKRAFTQNKVDAIVTYEPMRSNIIATGAKILFDSTEIPHEIFDAVVVRKSLIDSDYQNLQILIDGWFRALDYLNKNPQSAASKMAIRQNITAEQFLKSLEGLHLPSLVENKKLLAKNDLAFLQGLNKINQFMYENQLLNKLVVVDNLLDARLVNNVRTHN